MTSAKNWLQSLSQASIFRVLGYALLSAAVTLAFIIVAAVVNLLYFNDPPVYVASLDAPYTVALCPGQKLEVHKRIQADSSVQLFTYFEVTDLSRKVHILGTNVSNGPRSYTVVGVYDEAFEWTVPDIPPGKYNRTFTVRGTDGRENSIMTYMDFEIGENCK